MRHLTYAWKESLHGQDALRCAIPSGRGKRR
jgi:hypothetical protein